MENDLDYRTAHYLILHRESQGGRKKTQTAVMLIWIFTLAFKNRAN
jgi:hypothetical protein